MPNSEEVDKAAIAVAGMLQELDPGRLAELRRMDEATGAAAFWRLAARHPDTIGRRIREWMAIVRIIAILTAKGDPASRDRLHNPKSPLGALLCHGGDPGWPGPYGPRPVLSERRLGQLIAARGTQRQVLLTRAARAVARTRQSGSGVKVPDIAWMLLGSDHGRSGKDLARHYYRTLDRADRQHQTNQEGAEE